MAAAQPTTLSVETQMAAAPPLPPPCKSPPLFSHSVNTNSLSPSLLTKPTRRRSRHFRCEIKSFAGHSDLRCADTVHHSIQNSTWISSSSSMAATASALDSVSKDVKKVSLFYCSETKALAKRAAAESNAIEL